MTSPETHQTATLLSGVGELARAIFELHPDGTMLSVHRHPDGSVDVTLSAPGIVPMLVDLGGSPSDWYATRDHRVEQLDCHVEIQPGLHFSGYERRET